MSETETKEVQAEAAKQKAVVGGVKFKKHHGRRKTVGIIIIAVLLLAAAGVASYLLTRSDTPEKTEATKKTTSSAIKESDSQKFSKNYDKAAETSSQQYSASTNSDDKYVLALQTASVYESKGDCQTAIDWYQKAYAIKPKDRGVVSGLGRCYDKTGDKVKAVEFYQKTIDAIDPKIMGADNDIAYYQSLLDAAKAAQ